ncbi:TetR/AcrR family transcriptional regulator [Phenylobacterium aquaticum]|uniref:TetR/AcrR family transcriptional regulator n=1 Tax=Phenylobacterium aquaticum TaxID=1763816 RepID=UPI0026ED83BD|nr:TetR/AcrR family transcriptional regulator [Phenylobacterium aquaticum]
MTWLEGGAARRRSYHVGNLRAQLLEEARALLETGGIGQLNLRALAARAGIAPGSVYHHYASKQALLAGLAAEGFGELEAALQAAAGTQAVPIRTCALAYFGFARAQPALYALMFDPPILAEAEVDAARDRAFKVLEAAIAQAASQADRDEKTIHQIALAVWACGHGAAAMTLADPGDLDGRLMEEVISGLEALFRRR